ncbi:MAG: phospho-sugar mutase [Alphaproteobacteria bacterium]|nr:phospho-sugar mutase [Alphaproteobacteria bacterium]
MLDRDDVDALREHFSETLTFGTGGMRGTVGPGTARMNQRMVLWVSAALADVVQARVPEARRRGVVLAYDARTDSRAFAEASARVLAAAGLPVFLADQALPTPILAWAVPALGAAAGGIVTASHNPPADNGFKVFWETGAQIVSPVDTEVQARMAERAGPIEPPPLAALGDLVRPWPADLLDRYHAEIQALRVHPEARARVAYTPVHGVGGAPVRRALATAGHEVRVVAAQAEPDGSFPTVPFPNPEEPGVMDGVVALAEAMGADVAIANDPDADRCAVAVPGRDGFTVLSGNQLGVLLVDDLLASAPVRPDDLVVSTIVSTAMTRRIAAAHGVRYAEVLTGFKWIATLALAHEAAGGRFRFGFEESIGYSAGSVVRDKDGVSTALLVADLAGHLAARGETLEGRLEALYRRHGLHVGRQRSLRLPGTEGRARIDAAMARLRASRPDELAGRPVAAVRDLAARRLVRADGVEEDLDLPASDVVAFDLADGSRVLVRPSGTEPKIKVYLEVVEGVPADVSLASAREAAEQVLDRLEAAVLALAGLP